MFRLQLLTKTFQYVREITPSIFSHDVPHLSASQCRGFLSLLKRTSASNNAAKVMQVTTFLATNQINYVTENG
jgi:hypothetical protein